jgi:hypothetical protein
MGVGAIGRPDSRWHDLQRTHACILAQAAKDPCIVQYQLGHAHIQGSMGYISTADAETNAAVEKITAHRPQGGGATTRCRRDDGTTTIDRHHSPTTDKTAWENPGHRT